jgi:2-polyprenyl-3-methyl-5-hydroxy-6-metoxy-1,4-benzoquinol methylase
MRLKSGYRSKTRRATLMNDERLVDQQIAYYRARAPEYDQWFLREGRYDRGPEHRAAWFAEINAIRLALSNAIEDAHVLELACGTGLWTEQLAHQNRRVLAVDASPEAITINQNRVGADNVRYEVTDIFSWAPRQLFDAVFFAFWLSHVPPERFDSFWATVMAALKPDGLVFFVDSLLEQSSTAKDQAASDGSSIVRRTLNDGREFDIVKVFYKPPDLQQRLVKLGWEGWVRSSGAFFLYGRVSATGRQPPGRRRRAESC